MSGLCVLRPGMHDTVQDRGRFGYQALGFSPSGAMDRRSAAIANILVGNPIEAAVLECAYMGPRLLARRACVVCLTGADMRATLDGSPLEPYTAVRVSAGQVLDVGRAAWGVYAYLAVSGGIDVPLAMGSRSTSARYCLGGVEGRPLREGDVLPLTQDAPDDLPGMEARVLGSCDAYFDRGRRGAQGRPCWIRVVPCAGERRLGAVWLDAFYRQDYTVSARSDRMGTRLAGEVRVPAEHADIVSEGIALGTVQVPAEGDPIVVMVDHQTTGGYAKAGTVASVDLPRLAQCRPGDRVRFERVTVEYAQKLARQEASYLAGLRASVEAAVRRTAERR